LRFIHNWVIMGIQWMMCWWVLVHYGPLSFSGHLKDMLSRWGVKRGLWSQAKPRWHQVGRSSIQPLPSHNRLPMDGVQVAGAIALLGQSWTTTVETPKNKNKNSINTSLVWKHHIWTKRKKVKLLFLLKFFYKIIKKNSWWLFDWLN
jgi:hypothetical protein